MLISFLVALPIIYVHTLAGLHSTDKKLLEMARVFAMPWQCKIRYIYWEALKPHLADGFRITLGFCWKSGVAAEVIGVPAHSIGEKLYMSKIYLSTDQLLAWTVVVIILSTLFEKICLKLIGGICEINNPGLKKSYSGKVLFEGLNLEMHAPDISFLMGISGWGKTTFLRIVMGLERPDHGQVLWPGSHTSAGTWPKMGCVFQEDRFCEGFSAVENVAMVLDRKFKWEVRMEKARSQLLDVLDAEQSGKSGFQTVRRHAAPGDDLRPWLRIPDVIFMDEPFTGLDVSTRQQVIAYILKKQEGRLMLIVTHQLQDAQLLGARAIQMENMTVSE